MALLLFSSEMRREEHRIRRILGELDQEAEVYRSLERLYSRFQRPRGDICVMIFVISNRTILKYLVLLRDQMYDLPIALILPEADRATMSKAHRFYPRFIAFTDDDYSDLSLAIQHMIYRDCMRFGGETWGLAQIGAIT